MEMDSIKRIVIDPRFKVNYASYYIHGIRSLFSTNVLKFQCLEGINICTDRECRIGFALQVEAGSCVKRIYIDYGDWDEIYEPYYQWADVYAKINVRSQDADREKLLVIGPSFGIRLWSPITCLIKGLHNYRIIQGCCGDSFKRSLKQYIMDYGYMFVRRKSYDYYHRFCQEEKRGYAFSFSTLWYGKQAHETTNKLRGDFLFECRRLMEQFEGGFFYNNKPGVLKEFPQYQEYLQKYSDFIYRKRYPMREYDKRSRKSWFVFNTPSVSYCHGWKLAEFLCEGKAIISTRLHNLMPGDFTDGVHYIEANTREEIAKAIVRMRDDEDLLNKLKGNAYHYYNEYLVPEEVMRRIFDKGGIIV